MDNRVRAARRRAAFLRVLGECGNVTLAAAKAGGDRSAFYARRRTDAVFAKAWDAAIERSSERLTKDPGARGDDLVVWASHAGRPRVKLEPDDCERLIRATPEREIEALARDWPVWAHQGQLAPGGDWRVWVIMAGRGFGKTRAGAEWVSALTRADGGLRIALVAATIDEARRVMIEGPSGLLAVARAGEAPLWEPSRGRLRFASGAEAQLYSGANPESLRGPEHSHAWCDELAKWEHPGATWDMLQLGLRHADDPRALVTTTPRPGSALRRIIDARGTVLTGGPMQANPHLPDAYVKAVEGLYAGTRLGRQELDGELIEDVAGALWPRELIERCRTGGERKMARIVIGVDPPASADGDACGIVAAGLGADGIGYVIADHSERGLSPEGWARKVAAAVEAHRADRVIVEANQGGAMVESVLRAVEATLPLRLVHAVKSKEARAEPVQALFETGRAKLAGSFPELEDELAGMTIGGGYQGPGRSPDRADAMVWALDELMLRGRSEPSVRRL